MTREIFTKKGQAILVDDEDYDELNAFVWYVTSDGYAQHQMPGAGRTHYKEKMSRRLMRLAKGDKRKVDHKNLNRLDNRKENLRVCSNTENCRNGPKRKHNTSGLKGVFWHEGTKKWRARIGVERKSVHLGLFETKEEAHTAYCRAADQLHGEFANHGEA